MKKLYLAIRETFRNLIDPYYFLEKEKQERAERFSILEKLSGIYGSVGRIPLKVLEAKAGITRTREDLVLSSGLL